MQEEENMLKIRKRFYQKEVEFKCFRCGGTGELKYNTICTYCDGKGYYYKEVDD